MGNIPTFPTLVTRSGKGSALLDAEMDANWTNLRAYCLNLANIISSSLNPDGTLTANSVGTLALQAASVTLQNLNPSLLYSIVPVDTDSGTVNAYAITARGGLGGTNLIPGGAVYDANGNYVLTGLTLNYGYYWTKGASDISCAPPDQTPLSVSGSFTAASSTVTITGTPNAAITAQVALVAPISAYKNGQMFFVYTANASTSASTLNVNNLGAIPILSNGQPISNQIGASSVFSVVYENGSFVLFSGGGAGGSNGGTNTNLYNYTGMQRFSSGNIALPGASTTTTIAHGFNQVPTGIDIRLVCITADSGFVAGQQVPAALFQYSGAPGFVYYSDSTNVYVTQEAGTPSIGGTTITPSNWNLIVVASIQANTSTNVFPALDYMFVQPQGAFSYAGTLLVFNFGKSSNNIHSSAVNLSNNEITKISGANSGTPLAMNSNIFTRSSGLQEFVFTSSAGVYYIPAANPTVSIVPEAAFYGSSGLFNLVVTNGTAYGWVKGTNDISYSLDGGTTFITTSTFTGPSSGTVVLKGNVNSSVTAQVNQTSATWQPIQIWSNSNYSGFKPQWILESAGAITGVYVVTSDTSGNLTSNLQMVKITGNSSQNTIGTNLDLTNTGIVNIGAFRAGANSSVLLFQYNPFTKRIYVVTNEIGVMHIFQITGTYGSGGNDITAFWQDAARYSNLSYIKDIAISGMGAAWGSSATSHMYVEVNQNTGEEECIVFTRQGTGTTTPGSVTVIPWVE